MYRTYNKGRKDGFILSICQIISLFQRSFHRLIINFSLLLRKIICINIHFF